MKRIANLSRYGEDLSQELIDDESTINASLI